MAPPYIKRVLVILITLLGTAHAPAPGGSNACAADGSSASYSETISMAQGVTKRTIVTNGCPNHESYCTGKPGPAPTCKDKGEQGSDTEAIQQDVNVDIPANPILKSSYTPGELDCSMGAIAYALNGIGFYSGAVGYDENGNCPQLDVADPEAEWISFDCCTGHSDYEYAPRHFPVVLRSQQGRAHQRRPRARSATVPYLGPLGPGGVEIRNCGTGSATTQDGRVVTRRLPGAVQDRYYITGKVGDLNTLPSTPMPDSEELYYPYRSGAAAAAPYRASAASAPPITRAPTATSARRVEQARQLHRRPGGSVPDNCAPTRLHGSRARRYCRGWKF